MSQVEPEADRESKEVESRGEEVSRRGGSPDEVLDHYSLEFAKLLVDETVDGFRRGEFVDEAEVLDVTGGEVLMSCGDDVRVLMGKDETASNAGVYGFTVTPRDNLPLIDFVDQALELLQPNRVAEALNDPDKTDPVRQGEWWFLETDVEPGSRVYKGGVGSKPYGESPLGRHVPRDYAFGVCEEESLSRLKDRLPDVAEETDSVKSMVEQVVLREMRREVLGGIFVRGTVRHRDHDHSMINLGEQWHLALTHDVTVYTPDPRSIYTGKFLGRGNYIRVD